MYIMKNFLKMYVYVNEFYFIVHVLSRTDTVYKANRHLCEQAEV